MEKITPERLLTIKEAAAYLNLSKNTLYGYVGDKKGGPPYIKMGRALRYRKADLDAWLDTKTVRQ